MVEKVSKKILSKMLGSPSASASDAVERLKELVLDQYIETDEHIGPQIKSFQATQQQLECIGEQLTSLRDASTAQHEAHLKLSKLLTAGSGADADAGVAAAPSIAAFSERREGQARLSQHLATQYDRCVNLSVNQLEGLALVVANKYKSYCNKVVEMRRRKAQHQLLVSQKEQSDLRTLERSLIPVAPNGGFRTDLEGTLTKQSPMTRMWWSTYARLDAQRKVLLFTSRASEPPSAATKAVALCKCVVLACMRRPRRLFFSTAC